MHLKCENEALIYFIVKNHKTKKPTKIEQNSLIARTEEGKEEEG